MISQLWYEPGALYLIPFVSYLMVQKHGVSFEYSLCEEGFFKFVFGNSHGCAWASQGAGMARFQDPVSI